jgi:hypothetical protein
MYFFQTGNMPVSLEIGSEKGLKNSGKARRPLFSRQTAYLGIIVTPRPRGGKGIITLGRPDSLNFVSGNAHANTRATHQYAAIEITPDDSLADLPGDIGIVNGVTGIAPEILIGMAGLGNDFNDRVFNGNSPVVTADCDFHF